jgi:hypothetical protein
MLETRREIICVGQKLCLSSCTKVNRVKSKENTALETTANIWLKKNLQTKFISIQRGRGERPPSWVNFRSFHPACELLISHPNSWLTNNVCTLSFHVSRTSLRGYEYIRFDIQTFHYPFVIVFNLFNGSGDPECCLRLGWVPHSSNTIGGFLVVCACQEFFSWYNSVGHIFMSWNFILHAIQSLYYLVIHEDKILNLKHEIMLC